MNALLGESVHDRGVHRATAAKQQLQYRESAQHLGNRPPHLLRDLQGGVPTDTDITTITATAPAATVLVPGEQLCQRRRRR